VKASWSGYIYRLYY